MGFICLKTTEPKLEYILLFTTTIIISDLLKTYKNKFTITD